MKTYNFILEVPISVKSNEKPSKKALFDSVSKLFSLPLNVVDAEIGLLTIDRPVELRGDSIKVEI